ncbi:MAG: pyridoxamine kinase [Clostridia bacterium]|nr:pyridoxamine kinase [Clostridia bacterium]
MQKRILAINDISCMGKCSLTVALPIISSVGHECVILPTALLSTHTAQGFGDFVSFNMTDQMKQIADHFERLDTRFDAIYSGYIVSPDQADYIYELVNKLADNDTLVVVDPVLGDNGRLYRGFAEKNITAIKRLCSVADVITPNLTEASLLTGIESDGVHMTREGVDHLLDALSTLCKKKIVITGIEINDGELTTAVMDVERGETALYTRPKISGSVHGSGDVFASALTALYLDGTSFDTAVEKALDFTLSAIADSAEDDDSRWYGVNFEKYLSGIKGI